jgi:RNA polymerase sigma-70 factor, ECF subfamily
VDVASISAARAVSSVHDLDLDLVERHRCGDARAFEEVYSRHSEMVYNLALRLADEPETAADLSQEIFLRVFKHLASFAGRSSLKTWIYRIALNHCRGRLAGRRRWSFLRLFEEGEVTSEPLPDLGRGPAELALASEDGHRVEEGLRQLPIEFREAVVLRDLEGLSYEEIAEILGIRIGTVRSRIARGRDRLRTWLESER